MFTSNTRAGAHNVFRLKAQQQSQNRKLKGTPTIFRYKRKLVTSVEPACTEMALSFDWEKHAEAFAGWLTFLFRGVLLVASQRQTKDFLLSVKITCCNLCQEYGMATPVGKHIRTPALCHLKSRSYFGIIWETRHGSRTPKYTTLDNVLTGWYIKRNTGIVTCDGHSWHLIEC